VAINLQDGHHTKVEIQLREEIHSREGILFRVGIHSKEEAHPKVRNHGKVRLRTAHLKAERRCKEEIPFKVATRTRADVQAK
jgi:hypothetical protein